MVGPNRVMAKLRSRAEVEKFHKMISKKHALQQRGAYRLLWFRKMTVELRPFLMKYIRWFFVRVLKVKSLTGQREEVSAEQVSMFR